MPESRQWYTRLQPRSDATRRLIAFLIAIGVFALDRYTKFLVETSMNDYDTKTVIPGFFIISP